MTVISELHILCWPTRWYI